MEIKTAQADMRHAYYSGATGAIVSASAWLLSAFVALYFGELASIITLFLAAQFIFPLSVLVSKLLGRPGTLSKDNAFGMLGLEATAILIFCYPLAYVVSLSYSEWFYPAMLILIGVRYFMFTTLYGDKTYWAFAAVLVLAGYGLAILHAPFHVGAFAGAGIEYIFGVIIFFKHRSESNSNCAAAN